MTDQLLRLQEDIQAEQAKRFALEAELAELKEKQRQQPQVIAELKAKLKQSRQYAVDLANRPPTVIEKPVERVVYRDKVIEKPVEIVKYKTKQVKTDAKVIQRLEAQAAEAIKLQQDLQAEQQRRYDLESELALAQADKADHPRDIADLKAQIKQLKSDLTNARNQPAKVIEKPVERVVFRDRVKEVPGPERIIIKTEKAPSAKTEKVAPLNAKIKRLTKALDEHKLTLAELREKAAAAQATIDQQQAHINHITDQLRAKNVSSN